MCLASVALAAVSCNDDDDYPYTINALVTVKPIEVNDCYFQLDEITTLYPVNLYDAPYGDKEVRALVNFSEAEGTTGNFTKNVYVNWIDSIRTKSTVPTLGDLNDETYGNDPIEIVNDWVTIAEDGYLTLRFRVLSQQTGGIHYVNLLTDVDESDPYTVELRHNAMGDVSGVPTDGMIAFNLSQLPDTNGKTIKLTLQWKGYEIDKSVTFDFCTRKSSTLQEDTGIENNVPIDVKSIGVDIK